MVSINFVKSIEPIVQKFQHKAIEVGKNMNYTLSDASIAQDIFSRSANSCTIVNVNSSGQNLVAHIDPQRFNWKTFLNTFNPMIKNFQDKYGEAKAIIIGGWENGRIDPLCKTPSSEVYSTIAGALDDMPLTMICGKKANVKSFDNLFASKNQITLANDTFDKAGLCLNDAKNVPLETVEKQLKKYYEWVEIEPSMLK